MSNQDLTLKNDEIDAKNEELDIQNLKKQNLLGMVLTLIDENKNLREEADENCVKMCTIMRQNREYISENREYKFQIEYLKKSHEAKNQELLDLIEQQQVLLTKAKQALEERTSNENTEQSKQELEDGEIPDSEPEMKLSKNQRKKLKKKLAKLEKAKKKRKTRSNEKLLQKLKESLPDFRSHIRQLREQQK